MAIIPSRNSGSTTVRTVLLTVIAMLALAARMTILLRHAAVPGKQGIMVLRQDLETALYIAVEL
jgi:hypothetical protein